MLRSPRAALAEGLEGALAEIGVADPPPLELVRSKLQERGDYSTSVALKLASGLRLPPAAIASRLALAWRSEVADAEAKGGYVNFRLSPVWLRRLVLHVGDGGTWGPSDLGRGGTRQVEFASVNPTGPLHIGHGRGVILGDVLCRLLGYAGYQVQREYYVNDQNTQARRFGASIWSRLKGAAPPEGGYTGEYVAQLAEAARQQLPGIDGWPEDEAQEELRRFGVHAMVERLAESVARVGVHYDRWLYESSLWDEGLPQTAIQRLRQGGHLKEMEGALWFSPEVPGWEEKDEDRVVIRSNGEPTYFASDLGYLLSKFEERAFERAIVVWGADHHGYVPRIRAAMAALGIDPERLVVILNQLVNLKEGKMSKRQGRFVTMDELVDRVGPDAVRYFYLMRSPEAMMEFDLELATSRTSDNPVFYAQYAHARLANVEPNARDRHPALPEAARVDLLTEPRELQLARQIAYFPEVIELAATNLEPHRLPYYVHELADAVHTFYHSGNDDPELRVVVADPELTRARLQLCRAARHTLAQALGVLGVSAPERM